MGFVLFLFFLAGVSPMVVGLPGGSLLWVLLTFGIGIAVAFGALALVLADSP